MTFKCSDCGLFIEQKPDIHYFNRENKAYLPLCSNCGKKITNQLPSYNDIFFNSEIRRALENLILNNKFQIEDFFNLCILSENVILHNNLFTFNPYTVEILNTVFFPNENIFKLFNWDHIYRSEVDVINQELWKEQIVRLWQQKGEELGIQGISFETGTEFYSISELFNYSFSPTIEDMRNIEPIIILKGKTRINSNIYNAYSSLSKAAKKEIQSLKSVGSFVKIFIPPIMAVILDRITYPKEIPTAIMEMRNKSEKTRMTFKEYEETIKNENISLKESIKAANELASINHRISHSFDKKDTLNIKELINNLIPSNIWEPNKDDIDFKSLLSIFLKEPIESLSRRIKNRGVMYLIDLKSKYLEIKKYSQLIKKVWNYDLDDNDIAKWEKYSAKYSELFS